jgi:hypothetical protein
MTDLKTKESTLRALEKATRTPITPAEIRDQRLSFIMGSLDTDSPMTRAQVQQILAEQEGEKIRK